MKRAVTRPFILVDDEGLELASELFSALLLFIRELDGLTEVKREDTEDGLTVYLISARLEVHVTVKAYEDINELINVIDLLELNVECHNNYSFLNIFAKSYDLALRINYILIFPYCQ